MCVDGLLPFLLALVDADELVERRIGERRALAQLGEQLLGSVEEPRVQVVLGQGKQGLMPLRFVEVRTCQQVLVHADRALDLAAPAKQMAQGEMGFERIVVDLRHLHE